jgi:putative acetyltransferase
MINYIRTNSDNADFQQLRLNLEEELKIRDGNDHAYYAQLNEIDSIRHVIVAYENTLPVGCGAIREYYKDTVEIKRMYVLPGYRGKGIASAILKNLEQWAVELNYKKILLETGINQPEAIQLYKKNNYRRIPNYGKYQTEEYSVCFEKNIMGA